MYNIIRTQHMTARTLAICQNIPVFRKLQTTGSVIDVRPYCRGHAVPRPTIIYWYLPICWKSFS